MAWPNSVDATDDCIYVSDILNVRLLRIEKTFVLSDATEIAGPPQFPMLVQIHFHRAIGSSS